MKVARTEGDKKTNRTCMTTDQHHLQNVSQGLQYREEKLPRPLDRERQLLTQ
jgi:hypothetical protein